MDMVYLRDVRHRLIASHHTLPRRPALSLHQRCSRLRRSFSPCLGLESSGRRFGVATGVLHSLVGMCQGACNACTDAFLALPDARGGRFRRVVGDWSRSIGIDRDELCSGFRLRAISANISTGLSGASINVSASVIANASEERNWREAKNL